MLHTNLAADLCSFSDSKAVTGSMEESSVVQCVAVAYNRKLETPLGLLNRTIARLPNSVERVICINEEDQDIFACLANRKRDGRVYPSEIWRFDYAPPWRVTRHWLIDQTADSIRYLPEYVKKWFGTSPKTMSILEPPSSKGDVSETKRATVTFRAHRIHDDHIINILEDDEFDLRYQVWTM
ncbi:hypothetical protein RhiJN_24140 [Ceratobasidium sp. AG-Ba]|nr:hypothetical protein RhiJN_24140 [Ceratobasidium sp. AG-Ba]